MRLVAAWVIVLFVWFVGGVVTLSETPLPWLLLLAAAVGVLLVLLW